MLAAGLFCKGATVESQKVKGLENYYTYIEINEIIWSKKLGSRIRNYFLTFSGLNQMEFFLILAALLSTRGRDPCLAIEQFG